MAKWYIVECNNTTKAYSAEELVEKIRAGVLGPYDLTCQEGESQWASLISYSQWRVYFDQSIKLADESQAWALNERRKLWTVLRRADHMHLGPYTTEQLQHRLRQGYTSYTDYLWTEGMSQWCLISAAPEFARQNGHDPYVRCLSPSETTVDFGAIKKTQSRQVVKDEADADATELLTYVRVLQKQYPHLPEEMVPPEAVSIKEQESVNGMRQNKYRRPMVKRSKKSASGRRESWLESLRATLLHVVRSDRRSAKLT